MVLLTAVLQHFAASVTTKIWWEGAWSFQEELGKLDL